MRSQKSGKNQERDMKAREGTENTKSHREHEQQLSVRGGVCPTKKWEGEAGSGGSMG